jgi:hypothetical protein
MQSNLRANCNVSHTIIQIPIVVMQQF